MVRYRPWYAVVRYRHRGTCQIVSAQQWLATTESEIAVSDLVGPRYRTECGERNSLRMVGRTRTIHVPYGWWIAEGLAGGYEVMSPQTFANEFDEIEIQEATK